MTRWQRRLAWTAGGIVLLWALGWVAVPPLLKWQLQARGSELLGRALSVESVSFHPWNLDLTLRGLAIAASAPGGDPTLRVGRVHANLSASSLLRFAPVIEALEIDELQLRVARLADGHYDIDDLIERFTPRGDAAPSEPARFALYNVQVRNGQLRFDDRPVGRVHTIDDLQIALPFLSNLPAQVDVNVEPRLAFKLNGAAFDSGAQATPFAQTRHAELKLSLAGLDVAPYLGYLPRSLPVRLVRGTLSADLALAFTQPAGAAPVLTLRGSAAARELALADAAGAPLLSWRQLQLGLRDVQPLANKLDFDTLRIDGASLHLSRDASGRIALLQPRVAPQPPASKAASDAATASSAASAPPRASQATGLPWVLSLAALELADARVLWHDAAVQPAAALQLDGLSLKARQLTWPVAAPVALSLSAMLRPQAEGAGGAGQVAIEGQASDREAQIDTTVTDLSLEALAPYLAQALSPQVQGKLSARAQLDWSGDAAAPRLKVKLAQATLDGLQLQPGGRRAPAATGGASLAQLVLNDVQLDLIGRTVALAQVRLSRPSLDLVRDARGRLNVVQWLHGPGPGPMGTSPGPAQTVASFTAPPWHVSLGDVLLERGQLRWSDAAARGSEGGEPVRVQIDQLRLAAQQLEWHGERKVRPGKLQLSARVSRPAAGSADTRRDVAGTLDWKGELRLQPLLARGNLRVLRLPVHAFEPYFADRLPVSLLRAEAGYSGRITVGQANDGLNVTAAGDVLIGDLHMVALTPSLVARPAAGEGADELLHWDTLAVNRLSFEMKPGARTQVDIGEAVLTNFYSRLVVTEQGRFNLQAPAPASAPAAATTTAATPPSAVPAASAAASAPTADDAAGLPLDLRIGGTQLINGRVDFSDHFVRPNYSAALTELNGRLGALSSTSRDMASLELRGRVAGTGLLEISGRINPTVKPLALDVKAKASEIELAPLSPYAGKYAGYAIERGKLSVDLAYKIDPDGRLEASNQVVLNQLTFGERIESPDATKLPVLLAVALLKDRHGVIDINLPISGSLNDPQFSVGGIVLKLIVNLLVKALTAPFALLAGGGSDDLSFVDFAPGTVAITDAGRQTIDKVAKALNDRPALKMTVTGSSDLAAERDAYQRAALQARLLAERRRSDLLAGAAASAPEVALSSADRSRLLKAVYRQTDLPDKPRNVIGLAKDIPDAEMEALLLKHLPANADTMRELALQRGLAVRDALVAQGLASERLFLAAPKVGAAGGTGAPAGAASDSAAAAPAKARAQLALSVN